MKNSYEQRVQNQFGGFCTRVLKNEANRILNEYARQRDREKVFVVGDLLAEALSQLPEDKRDVILLSYFLGMTDR